MEKNIKTLTKLSLVLQKWVSVSYNLSIVKLVHHVPPCNVANYSVSEQEKNPQKHFANKEITELRENKINSLLQTLVNEKNLKNDFNAYTALRKLAKSYKQVKHSYKPENIIGHIGFVNLCDKLVETSSLISPYSILRCLHNLADLGVPVNSIIFQRFLQLLRPFINNFTLPMNISLLRLLEHNTHTNLSNALYEASQIIFEEQLRTDLNTQDNKTLLLCLQEVAKRNNEEEIDNVVHAISELNEIDTDYLASIFFALCHITSDTPKYWEVMYRVQHELARELANSDTANKCALAEEKIVYFITTRYKEKFKRFYDVKLISVIISDAMTGKLSFENCVKIASYLSSIRKPNLRLLECLAIQFWERKNQIPPIQESPMVLVELLTNFAVSNYKPFLWDPIEHHVMGLAELQFSTEMLINLCHSLAVLQCDCAPFLEKLFHTLENVTNLSKMEKFRLIRLYYAIKTFGTKYTGSLANDFIMLLIDEVYDQYTKLDYKQTFKGILAKALGGEQFLYSYLKTKAGHIIDFAIVIGKDGHLVPICTSKDQTVIYVENIEKLSSDQIILIIALPSHAYFGSRINGSWSMTLRAIEAYTGHDVIPINHTILQNFDSVKQTQFIMEAIKLKCNFLHKRIIDNEMKSFNAADGDDSNC